MVVEPRATETLTHADLVDRTRALLPAIAARAQAAEETRRVPDATMQDFADVGFFRVMVPTRYNGLELDVSAVTDVGRLIGRACASTSWVISWLGWHNRGLAMFPQSVQDEVFARGFGLTAGSTTLTGVATKTAGGYRVTGRWSWGTGIHNADWASIGAVIAGTKTPVTVLARRSELILHDNWHTEGMRATGSDDMELRDAFIPEERILDMTLVAAGTAPGQQLNPGPLYRCPTRPIACLVATAAAIGVAEGAVDNLRERMSGRELAYSGGQQQRDQQAAQIRLANASAEVHAAGLLYASAVDLVARACRGEHRLTLLERAQVRLWTAHAVSVSRRAVGEIVAVSGARSHFLDDPLQRAARDINTLAGHIVFDYDRAAEVYGRVALGLELDAAAFV